MNKYIVTTTINPPTEAIKLFDGMDDWKLIVVGDLKTPKSYKLKNGYYFTPEEQEKYDKKLSDLIGWNSIQRRNFGYLLAKDNGADVIATVDDDNIPSKDWGKKLYVGEKLEVNFYSTKLNTFDPVGATNYSNLWHRGFPLQLLAKREYENKTKKTVKVDIQADFWDGDPDIDAICRMEHAPECKFSDKYFPIASNRISPFNSQNTFLKINVLKDYFLFPHIGRMDDIWGGFYAQSKGHNVIYSKSSVYQKRNIHDLTKDMKAEYLGYENNLEILKNISKNPDYIFNFLPKRSLDSFRQYSRHFK